MFILRGGYGVLARDLDGDGDDDLIFTNYNSINIIYSDGSYPSDISGADEIINMVDGGLSVTVGKLDGDGDYDIAAYYQYTSMVHIFYNDGDFPSDYSGADVNIEIVSLGEYAPLGVGDFNNDNSEDLVCGDYQNLYIFYNDGSYPVNSSGADAVISTEDENFIFGSRVLAFDFDNDSDDDLLLDTYELDPYAESVVVSLFVYSNDGSYPASAESADLIISGDKNGTYFGAVMTSGDFNNDSKTDLAVGAHGYSMNAGAVYVFYNKGSQSPISSDSADLVIVGEDSDDSFGYSLSSGDINSDNQTDLIIGAKGYSTNKGRVYIIYNDGTYPSLASDADIKIDGENNNDNFGYSITTGDIAGDNKTDLIISATGYSTNTGRTYIINNDGSIPTLASNADTIITGENANDNFGISLITGDFDYDMDNDLVIGSNYNNNTGRAYIFNNDGSYPNLALNSDIKIDGESTNNYFSGSFAKGDFNNDNRIDLVVGAYGYNEDTGRVYIFNNDGNIPTIASTADSIISGEGYNNYFGASLASGNFDSTSRTDLLVGAYGYQNYSGGAYLFSGDGSIPVAASGADMIMSLGFSYDGDNGISRLSVLGIDFDGNNKLDLCFGSSRYLGYNGSVFFYTLDAEGTKPDYVKSRGGATFRGGVKMR